MKIIDANVVLRYLLKDELKLFSKASEFIENNDFIIPNEVLAEIVYVLEKVYKVPRIEIRNVIQEFINSRKDIITDKELIMESLNAYEKYNLDFVDSILFSYKKVRKHEVITLDKKLNKILNKN